MPLRFMPTFSGTQLGGRTRAGCTALCSRVPCVTSEFFVVILVVQKADTVKNYCKWSKDMISKMVTS
jgi:hypothetical protein